MALLLVLLFVTGLVSACYVLYTPTLKIADNRKAKPELSKLDRWLSNLYGKGKFSGTVLIGQGEDILFNKSFGFEDLEETKPLSTLSVFNLASVSKQFTAMAIVILEHEGKLSYQDSLSTYLPELNTYSDVTVENLLHHTSGIPDYMKLARKHGDLSNLFTTDDLITLYEKQQPPAAFDPGSRHQYSNTGYVILAEIVARVAGMPFDEFMRERIFLPSGMKNTQVFNLLSSVEPKNRVFGFKRRHWMFGGGKQLNDLNNFDGVTGDGGIYSTAEDLYRWHRSLTLNTLLPSSVYKKAYQSGVLNSGQETGYGYGWVIRNEHIVDHAGSWVGFSSFIYRNMASDTVIVVLDNSTNTTRITPFGFPVNSISLNLIKYMDSCSIQKPV
jgi:CubicO group peptidase (beta-lactamase class C family)